jgi:hypothetical protein
MMKNSDTGKNWALILLSQFDKEQRAKMLYLAEDMVYEKQYYFWDGKCGIEQLALYLIYYYDAFQGLKNKGENDNVKGKRLPMSTPTS